MTLLELIEAVVNITGRTDLRGSLIPLAVKEATKRIHSAAEYKRDLRISDPIVLDNSNGISRYVVSRTVPELIRPRKIGKIQESLTEPVAAIYNFSGEIWGQLVLNELDIEHTFDAYGMERYNYFILNGSDITMVSARPMQAVRMHYYQYPDVGTDTFSSWIAEDIPHAIYNSASARVFQSVGKMSEYSVYKNLEKEDFLEILKQDTGI